MKVNQSNTESKKFQIPMAVTEEVMARRTKGKHRYSGVSMFSSKIKCGECGCWFGSKVWHSTDKYRRVIYQCNHKYKGDKPCATPHITEDEVKKVFVRAVNGDWGNGEERKRRLTAAGYDYTAVQAAVNAKLAGTKPKAFEYVTPKTYGDPKTKQ